MIYLQKLDPGNVWTKIRLLGASKVALLVKNPPAMQETQETWVRSLGWEDPLEEDMASHFSILAWRIPWTEEPGRLQSIGSQSRTRLSKNKD